MPELTICIFGGTGFVGRRLAAALAREDHLLRIPTRYREGDRRLLVLPTVKLIQADIHDDERLRDCLRGADVAINLVGILNEKGRDGSGFARAHDELAARIVDACIELGVPRLLHMSALKANAERGPSHYLRSKGRAEQRIRERAGDTLDWTIFQPSVIFGPEDDFTNRFARLLRLSPVLPLAKPHARLAPVYVEDVVLAMMAALNDVDTHGRTIQLCGPQIYSLGEIVRYVARQLGLRRAIVGLPDTLSRIQARMLGVLPGKPFSMDNYLSLTVNSICSENGFEPLGIRPRSLELIAPEYLRRR
jgi:NADH dehydrogenase